jgi:hypothetical protein
MDTRGHGGLARLPHPLTEVVIHLPLLAKEEGLVTTKIGEVVNCRGQTALAQA